MKLSILLMFINVCINDETFKSAAPLDVKMYIEDIQVYCRRALKGDKEALEKLGKDDISYPKPTSPQPVHWQQESSSLGLFKSSVT